MAAAMPHDKPPPPNAATTQSTSGRSSRISSPQDALPAMNSSSSKGCTNVPFIAGCVRSASAVQHWSNVAITISAPSRRAASSLAAGAVSITSTLHGTPALRAASATPWAALPGADGPHAVPPLLFRQQPDRVIRSANLERPDGLQALQLQVNLGRAVIVQPHQRSAYRRFVNVLARIVDESRRNISLCRLFCARKIACHGNHDSVAELQLVDVVLAEGNHHHGFQLHRVAGLGAGAEDCQRESAPRRRRPAADRRCSAP